MIVIQADLVTFDDGHRLLPGGRIPYPGGIVITAGCYILSIRAKYCRAYRIIIGYN